ncbi:MAG TPA: M15 family metallopeptidase [Spirochaetales bacterium]|nr:M15 family metallopeptidase [Spirochaetales bacterium]
MKLSWKEGAAAVVSAALLLASLWRRANPARDNLEETAAQDEAEPPRLDDLDLLRPDFRAKIDALYQELRAQGFEPLPWETLRTPERQAWLYAQGRTRPGAIVTQAVSSVHEDGRGVDTIDGRRIPSGPFEGQLYGWGSWGDPDVEAEALRFFNAYGRAAEALGLTWGGRWTTLRDYPHVEA